MISFVYFDLGGVVEKDFSATNKLESLRKELGIPGVYSESFGHFWKEHDKEICTTWPVEEILTVFKQKFNAVVPADYSLLDAMTRRFEKNESLWPLLKKIHTTTRMGLLTNMYVGMFDSIKKYNILPDIPWDVIIDSTKVGYKKPEKEIYEIAQAKARVPGNEILFIDNGQVNLDGAKACGWQTFFYDSRDYEKSSQELATFWSAR